MKPKKRRKKMGLNEDLIKAAKAGDMDTLLACLENEPNINVRDKYNQTALMLAAENGYTRVVSLLIDKGADMNAKDNEGRTALMRARELIERDRIAIKKCWCKGIEISL
jgi:ankyrin repeat protein